MSSITNRFLLDRLFPTTMALLAKKIKIGLLKTTRKTEKRKRHSAKGSSRENKTQIRLIKVNPTSAPFTVTSTVILHKDRRDESTRSAVSASTCTDNLSSVTPPHNKARPSILHRTIKRRGDPKNGKGRRPNRISSSDAFTGTPTIMTERPSITSVDERLTIPSEEFQEYRILIPNHSSTNSSQPNRGSWRADTTTSHLTGDTTTNEKWKRENGTEHDSIFSSGSGCFGVSDEQLALILAAMAGCVIFLV